VAFCKDTENLKTIFDKKIEKYSIMANGGRPLYEKDRILPIVINYRGIVYEESR